MNISQHIWLVAGWLLYGFLHSFLARNGFKKRMEVCMKGGYKYYRILYSLFAAITLILLLWYQFTIESYTLWSVPPAENAVAIVTGFAGVAVMLVCIKKYFYNLSGIDVFIKKNTVAILEREGLHRIVRHPLYAGTLLFIWSVFFYHPSAANCIACICITAYTLAGIYLEEQKLVAQFGDVYKQYSKKVPMLIPGFVTHVKQ